MIPSCQRSKLRHVSSNCADWLIAFCQSYLDNTLIAAPIETSPAHVDNKFCNHWRPNIRFHNYTDTVTSRAVVYIYSSLYRHTNTLSLPTLTHYTKQPPHQYTLFAYTHTLHKATPTPIHPLCQHSHTTQSNPHTNAALALPTLIHYTKQPTPIHPLCPHSLHKATHTPMPHSLCPHTLAHYTKQHTHQCRTLFAHTHTLHKATDTPMSHSLCPHSHATQSNRHTNAALSLPTFTLYTKQSTHQCHTLFAHTHTLHKATHTNIPSLPTLTHYTQHPKPVCTHTVVLQVLPIPHKTLLTLHETLDTYMKHSIYY